MEQIVVKIAADGEVKVSANGVSGAGCASLTKAIEQAIGRTTSDVKTPEYFQRSKQAAENRAGGARGAN